MTAATVAAMLALPHHALLLSVLAAMTAAAAAACLSDFTIVSESTAGMAALSSALVPNKPFQNYLVFSLVSPVDLPTIADTSAMQHTMNQRDLLHNFTPLAVPSRLVCTDSGHIKCLGHSTLHGTTIINRQTSDIVMCNVAYMPGALHTLISPQQLLNAGCHVTFDQQHGFLFYLDDQLHLFSYCSGNLYYFTITFTPTETATPITAPSAVLVVTDSSLCLDLVHCWLGHASEKWCHEFVQQLVDFSVCEKHVILSSLVLLLCEVCLVGKQTACGVSRVPCTNHAVWGTYPGDLLSLDLIGPMRQWLAGGHVYLLTVMDLYLCMHFVCLLPNKTLAAICVALCAIAVLFPPAVCIHCV
jgi:hypothetical protein